MSRASHLGRLGRYVDRVCIFTARAVGLTLMRADLDLSSATSLFVELEAITRDPNHHAAPHCPLESQHCIEL